MTFGTALSTVSYRDMGHGMGQRISLKILPNNFGHKTKEKFRNHGGFGTFMAKVHEVDTILQEWAMQQLIAIVLEGTFMSLANGMNHIRSAYTTHSVK